MANHDYVPRRDYDTGEAPYTIRQYGHCMACVKCGGSPLSHAGPGGWPWWRIFGSLLLATALTLAAIKFLA